VLGLDVAQRPKQVQTQIGVCFEITNLYEQMTGLDNLTLFARLFGVREFDAPALLGRVGLEGRGRDRVETYSKGVKQRLMVARALVNRPRILFLDEPTEGLDPASAASIRQIILEERARGATVFLTTHDMLEADKLSDRVAFIERGKIVALDTPHALKQRYGQRRLRADRSPGRASAHLEESWRTPMYGERAPSLPQKAFLVVNHLIAIVSTACSFTAWPTSMSTPRPTSTRSRRRASEYGPARASCAPVSAWKTRPT
jgi:ABC-type multidrug transport system ATPase subunit